MKKKKHFSTFLLVIVFLAGLSLLLYPSVSNYLNSMHSSSAISNYAQKAASVDLEELERMWREARGYNERIPDRLNAFALSEQEEQEYYQLLSLENDRVMGYIEIPSIEVALPIYHGTSDRVLQVAVGHLEWSSLPVGGEGTHCVLSGHRGLPSAKLFTNLDRIVEGDVFMLRVLDDILTYEVDQILIVDPHDTQNLQIVDGKDYCTLVTCTPYGVNTHRLLVRGHRIETTREQAPVFITGDAYAIDPLIVAPIAAIPLLLVLLLVLVLQPEKKKQKHNTSMK